jgi:hypothetical protein
MGEVVVGGAKGVWMPLDSQVVELLGQQRLAGELLRAGLEVAFPARDRGIDLIAYADTGEGVDQFSAKPIQMKAASHRSFGIWKKYFKFPDMLIAYVWHLNGEHPPVTFALTVAEAEGVAEAMAWTKTSSWIDKGGYGTTRPSKKLLSFLEPFEMSPEGWWNKVTGL